MKRFTQTLILAVLFLAACAPPPPEPTPTPTHTLTYTPTITLTPTITFTPSPLPTLTPTPLVLSGRLAFINSDSMGYSIMTYDLESGIFTKQPLPKSHTEWGIYFEFVASPDGRYLAYETMDKNHDIYVLDLVENKVANITNNSWWDSDPAWSPDGTKLAYATSDIYIYDFLNKRVKNITKHPAGDSNPTWSPDGERIAFTSDRNGKKNQLFVMNADGSNVVQLTEFESPYISSPKWSPDGKKISVFLDDDLYIINPDGTDLTKLNDSGLPRGEIGWNYSWSTDGLKILFALLADENKNNGIYLIDIYTKEMVRLTKNYNGDYTPTWSPDGRFIAYESSRPDDGGIYVIDSKGKGDPVPLLLGHSGASLQWLPPLNPEATTLPIPFPTFTPTPLPTYTSTPSVTPTPVTSLEIFPISESAFKKNHTFAFILKEETAYSIYVMNLYSGEPIMLAIDSEYIGEIAWSPDGSKLAFAGNHLYLLDYRSGVLTQITKNEGKYLDIKWSPDGEKIAFVKNFEGKFYINVKTSDGSLLIFSTNGAKPDWSPDGSRIVFQNEKKIYVTDSNGENLTLLTEETGSFKDPRWSPDGSKIAYVSYSELDSGLYIMNADGSNKVNIYPEGGLLHLPKWSPDGKKIIFGHGDLYNMNLLVMNANGSNVVSLLFPISEYFEWSPDGNKILVCYDADHDYYNEVYIINVDGSGLKELADLPGHIWNPIWFP